MENLKLENISSIKVNEHDFNNIVKELLLDCKVKSVEVEDAKFHHNASYEKSPEILKEGILSVSEKAKRANIILSKEEMNIYNDEGHVNGIDYISLSCQDIDYGNRRENKFYYDFYNFSHMADITISSLIKARRFSTNYANEYLAETSIAPEYFKAVDIRILNSLNDTSIIYSDNSLSGRLKKSLEYYNQLKYIASAIIENNLDIPFREVSEENITLDPEKVKKLPILIY